MIKALLTFFFLAAIKTGPIMHEKEKETDNCPAETSVTLRHDTALKRIDVFLDGRLFTSFRYADTLEKPVFYPVYAPSGVSVTRGYPIDPRQGERIDHPHHSGLWLNYGSVNGLDFWNNSRAIPAEKRCNYGQIKCLKDSIEINKEDNTLQVYCQWIGCKGEVLLAERSVFRFATKSPSVYSMERITHLTAIADSVVFDDSKEGLLGMRVAKCFEMPLAKPAVLYDTIAGTTGDPVADSSGVHGWYMGSNGLFGSAVWGTRNSWVTLSAACEADSIIIGIVDHPDNHGFPSYWNAREYGLFSVNNLGVNSYDPKQPSSYLKMELNEIIVFRHLLLVKSGGFLSKADMEKYSRDFWEEESD
jgi:hypothetical protein